jgi:hypothetical protein
MLSNPPYGVDWKKVQEAVESEHQKRGLRVASDPGYLGSATARCSSFCTSSRRCSPRIGTQTAAGLPLS